MCRDQHLKEIQMFVMLFGKCVRIKSKHARISEDLSFYLFIIHIEKMLPPFSHDFIIIIERKVANHAAAITHEVTLLDIRETLYEIDPLVSNQSIKEYVHKGTKIWLVNITTTYVCSRSDVLPSNTEGCPLHVSNVSISYYM